MTEQRINGDQFIQELKKAPQWMIQEAYYGGLHLTVMEDGVTKDYFGPDPLEETDIDYRVFLNNVASVAGIPAVQQRGVVM